MAVLVKVITEKNVFLIYEMSHHKFVAVVQSLSHVSLFVTPWTAACQTPHPSVSPRVFSNSCPFSQWCYLSYMTLKKFQEIVKDKGAWCATGMGWQRFRPDLVTEQQQQFGQPSLWYLVWHSEQANTIMSRNFVQHFILVVYSLSKLGTARNLVPMIGNKPTWCCYLVHCV